jgi:hypothetical protein
LTICRKDVGAALGIAGSVVALIGSLAVNLLHDQLLAREIWLLSNPLLLAWAIGAQKRWWGNGLGIGAIVMMYAIYTITGILSFEV